MEKEVDAGNPWETPRVSDGLGTLLERDSKGNILKLTAAADHLSDACSQVKPVNQSLTH